MRQIADACGKLVARSEAAGRPVEAMDAFLAATAQVHQLTLVTRNTAHFQFDFEGPPESLDLELAGGNLRAG